uniref:Sulfotransferase n=1 Tax=Desulfacinum infernum TaxID=35837 RepID=A0A832A3K4_9BACT
MILFNFKRFFKTAVFSVLKRHEFPAPFDAKRVLFLVAFFLGYPVVQVFNRLCFLLDDIFFPQWKNVELKPPVFIVGNPRSGTTFIHRVMARDDEQFFCFKAWEIIFPAVVQKKALAALGRVDRALGSPVGRMVLAVESRMFRDFNKMHHLSLFAPEEDDKLTLHIFSSLDLLWFFPTRELTEDYAFFDQKVPAKDRRRIMLFYRDCIKRQAFYKGTRGHLLSKNPVCPPKILSLRHFFPGCRFIYPVRNPLEVVPSMVSMAHAMWAATVRIAPGFPMQEQVYETLKHYYLYPLRCFETFPKGSYVLVKYDDLMRHPKKEILRIYKTLGFAVSERFEQILDEEEEKARRYKSEHVYSLAALRISRDRILSDLQEIFQRFGFATETNQDIEDAKMLHSKGSADEGVRP